MTAKPSAQQVLASLREQYAHSVGRVRALEQVTGEIGKLLMQERADMLGFKKLVEDNTPSPETIGQAEQRLDAEFDKLPGARLARRCISVLTAARAAWWANG